MSTCTSGTVTKGKIRAVFKEEHAAIKSPQESRLVRLSGKAYSIPVKRSGTSSNKLMAEIQLQTKVS